MKQLLTILLALGLIFSFSACASELPEEPETQPTTETTLATAPPVADTQPPVPTEEELALMEEFHQLYTFIISDSTDYTLEDGTVLSYLDATNYVYQRLLAMESLDRWFGTEFLETEETRLEILDRTTYVEDTLLYYLRTEAWTGDDCYATSLDPDFHTAWDYNQDGTIRQIRNLGFVVQLQHWYPLGNQVVRYDESNRVAGYDYYNEASECCATADFLYDDQGRITVQRVAGDYGNFDFLFTYNDDHQLVQISWQTGTNDAFTQGLVEYTYDEAGRCITERYDFPGEQREIYTLTNSYDENGLKIASEELIEYYEGTHNNMYLVFTGPRQLAFTYDTQGRIATETMTDMAYSYYTPEEHGELVECKEIYHYIYGNYCSFD